MKAHSFVNLAFYFIVATIATIQLIRTGAATLPLCKDILRVQHLLIITVCFFRIVVIALSNAFYGTPGVIVLLFQLGTFLMFATFGSQAVQWGKIGLFTLDQSAQAKLGLISKIALGVMLVVTLVFPILLFASDDREMQKSSALAGAFTMGGLTTVFSLVLLVFGCSLLGQIKVAATASKAKSGASTGGGYSILLRRLAMAVITFTICFALQGVGYIISVQSNALNDETAFEILPIIFHALDCLALTALLFLLSRGIAARAHKAKKSGPSSWNNDQQPGNQSSGNIQDTTEMTTL